MWSKKSPGLKILWLWTFGTAAVLVTNVVRTRLRDMEQLVNNQQQQQQHQSSLNDSTLPVSSPGSDEGTIREVES